MVDPSTLPYDELLGTYLVDRKLKRKPLGDQQRRDLELMSRREMAMAGRFYISKHSYNYAIAWLQRAGNYALALQVLGILYLRQPHLAPDSNEKARMYLMQSQNSLACHHLGDIYNNGVGVPKDKQEALRWFIQGGLQGNRKSKYEAGLIYFQDAQKSCESAKLAYYWLKSALKKKRRKKKKKETLSDMVAKKLEELIDMLDYDIEELAKDYDPYRDRREVHNIEDNNEDDSDNSSGEDDSGSEMDLQPESSAMAASENNSNLAQPQSSLISTFNSPSPFMAAANNMAQPESSFMALSRDAIQVQSSFIPLPNNAFQPESSSMAASNNPSPFMTAANDTQPPPLPPFSNTSQPEYSITTRSKSRGNNNMTQPDQSARVQHLQEMNRVYKRTIRTLEGKIHKNRRARIDYIDRLERENKSMKKKIENMENLFYWIAQNEANNQ